MTAAVARVYLPVRQTVRQQHQVGGEAVTADVRALPGLGRPDERQGGSDGSPVDRAALVVPSLRADEIRRTSDDVASAGSNVAAASSSAG